MAVISTGLGFTTKTGEITQKVCLPDNASELVFDWNFVSEEFKEFCSTQFDDKFKVSVIDEETSVETELFHTSVNILCESADSLTKAEIDFDRGDVWYTGWKNQTVDISAFQGKSVRIKLYVTDIGDSRYDTAILIDNVKLIHE